MLWRRPLSRGSPCAGRGRCLSSGFSSPSQRDRCSTRASGTGTTASLPSPGARSRWRRLPHSTAARPPPARHLWQPTLALATFVFAVFLAVDFWFYRKDRLVSTVGETVAPVVLRISGGINLVLIGGVAGAILASAAWKTGISFQFYGATL